MLVRNVTMEEADQLYPLICLSVRKELDREQFQTYLMQALKKPTRRILLGYDGGIPCAGGVYSQLIRARRMPRARRRYRSFDEFIDTNEKNGLHHDDGNIFACECPKPRIFGAARFFAFAVCVHTRIDVKKTRAVSGRWMVKQNRVLC